MFIVFYKILSCLNLQHNSTIEITLPRHGRHEGRTVTHCIQHSNTNSYSLKSFSHSTSRWHEVHFNNQVLPISSESVTYAVQQGLKIWKKAKDIQPPEYFTPIEFHHPPTMESLHLIFQPKRSWKSYIH